MVAIAVLLLVFVGVTNLVVDEYAKGALRTIVDDASQQGATAGGSLAACQAGAASVRAALLPGPFGREVKVTCAAQGDAIIATASGYLPSLAPPVPRAYVSISGFAVLTGEGG